MTIENATGMDSTIQSKSGRPEYKAMLEHYCTKQLNLNNSVKITREISISSRRSSVHHANKRDK